MSGFDKESSSGGGKRKGKRSNTGGEVEELSGSPRAKGLSGEVIESPKDGMDEEEGVDGLVFEDPFEDEFEEEEYDEDDGDDDEDIDAEEGDDGDDMQIEGNKKVSFGESSSSASSGKGGGKEGDADGEGNHAPKQVWRPGVDKLEEGEELEYDPSAYVMYHSLRTEWPCLSFDILQDNLGDNRQRVSTLSISSLSFLFHFVIQNKKAYLLLNSIFTFHTNAHLNLL